MTKKALKTAGGRVTIYLDGPEWDGAIAATLGDFSCKTTEDGEVLLSQAFDHIRTAGRDRIIGPMNGDTWNSYRFVSDSDGSPPFLLEPTNKPHEREAFHAAGFTPIGKYFSARVPLGEAAASSPPSNSAFTIETWDGKDPEGLFRQVFELSVRAFSRNAFYKAISEEAFLAMYMPIVPMLKKDLIFFARRPDGELAGFLFAIPNYAEGPQPKTVIVKTYASLQRGAGGHLLYSCEKTARDLGYDTAIHALMHESNQSAERSVADGATIFRRYELLGLRLYD